MSDEVLLQLDQGFVVLAQVEDPAVAAALTQLLADPSISSGDWQTYWEVRFNPVWFTPTLASFWDHAVGGSGMAQARVTAHSARCAGSALGGLVGRTLAGQRLPAQMGAAAGWLGRVSPRLDATTRREALSAASRALDRTGASGGTLPTVMSYELGMALGPLAGDDAQARNMLAGLLGLSEGGRLFWSRHNMLLLDGGMLSRAHVESLSSLVSVVPPALHRVVAIVIRDAVGPAGLPPAPPGRGQTVLLDFGPMEVVHDPSDFIQDMQRPAVPLFTLNAAAGLVHAIQEVQFAARPELRVWRDAIIRHAGVAPKHRLRRSVDAAVYQARPDAFLPDIAYLWFSSTRMTFDLALSLSRRGNNDPLASFLLFGDLMSGGDSSLRVFQTGPQGQVMVNTVPAGRVTAENSSVVLLGTFTLDGTIWSFVLNEYGHVRGHSRR
jgi:hypothetical protein